MLRRTRLAADDAALSPNAFMRLSCVVSPRLAMYSTIRCCRGVSVSLSVCWSASVRCVRARTRPPGGNIGADASNREQM